METDVILKGSKEFNAILENIGPKLRRNMPAILQHYVNDITEHAKHHHRFETQSNQLEDSVTGKVLKDRLSFKVFLDPTFTTTEDEDDYDYGVGIHNGTERNGREVWKADPFVYNAFRYYKKGLLNSVGRVLWRTLNLGK